MYKNNRRFDGRYPDVWEQIIREKTGQIQSRDGLFTFVTIYPLQKRHLSSNGSVEAFEKSAMIVDDASYFWILLTHIPQARLNEEIHDHVKQGTLQFLIVSLIVMPLIWFYSRERVFRKWAHRELHNKEQYLRTITSQLAEGLLVIDRQGSVVTMNKEVEHLLGWTPETDLPQAETIAERLRECIAEMSVVVDKHTNIQFTVCIGVSAYPESADAAEKLVKIADERLYKAKAGGRNRVVAETGDGRPLISIAASEGKAYR